MILIDDLVKHLSRFFYKKLGGFPFYPSIYLGDDKGIDIAIYSLNFNFSFGGDKKTKPGLYDKVKELISGSKKK